MPKTPRRRVAITAAASVAITSAFLGLGIASPAQAACTAEAIEAASPGCGGTSTPSATPSPTDTDVKPTSSATTPESGATVTAAPSPSSVSPVSGPPTVRGTFTLGNGSPLVGATVTLTATDSVPDDGTSVTPAAIGTVTTGADGSWSYTLPASLPTDAQALADDNGGVLSLEAAYVGTAPDGTVLTGYDYVDAGVASGTATTEGSAQARTEAADTVAIHPDVDSTTVTPADDAADANTDVDITTTDEAATPTWQKSNGASVDGYNPNVVNGVDYSAVKPQIGVPSCGRVTHTVKTGIYYTTVGEAHAFYDTTASFEYNDTLSSTWGVATSVDGETWSITGKVTRKSSMGHATGFTGQGPYWAKRFRVPIEYKDIDHQTTCAGNVKHAYSIVATKYKIPAGGSVSKYGADVTSKDGPTSYSHSKKSYRAVLQKQTYFTLTHGASVTWGIAVKVFGGITLSLDTEYGSQHYQKITAGSGKHEHDIWGAKGPISEDPGVIYSY